MPIKIPPALIDFIRGKPGWVATASPDGMPNVSIKGSLRVLDAENLIFADLYSLKTRANLLENPNCAIMVYEESSRKGYCFKGRAELISRGPVYDQIAEQIKLRFPDAPPPKYAVKVGVEAIYDQSMGPEGGKKIA